MYTFCKYYDIIYHVSTCPAQDKPDRFAERAEYRMHSSKEMFFLASCKKQKLKSIMCAVVCPALIMLVSCGYKANNSVYLADSGAHVGNGSAGNANSAEDDLTSENGGADKAITPGTEINGTPAYKEDASYERVKREIVVESIGQTNAVSEDVGVTLEVTGNSSQAVFINIANNTEQSVQYGDGFQLYGKQWGYAGQADQVYQTLQPGEQQSVYVNVSNLGPGEFRITLSVILDNDDRTEVNGIEISAEFIIENKSIPTDVRSVMMKADEDFSAPYGTLVEITNGFDNGRIFFDKYCWLQKLVDGTWEDIPPAGPDSFTYETYSLAPRQKMPLTIYWAWLYDDLPPGEYRVGKCFLHQADDGTDTQYEVYAEFSLDGEPVPGSVRRGFSEVRNPLGGITVFRAEAVEHLSVEDYRVAQGGKGMLVESLTTFWEGWNSVGEPLYIYDNLTAVVLDSGNDHISFSDIPIGAEMEITFSGMVLTSYPGIIGGTLLIIIVG